MATVIEACSTGGASLGINNTQQSALGGDVRFGATSTANVMDAIRRTAGVFSGLCLRIQSNTITATSTATLQKNASNGSEAVSILTSATGEVQDTTHTDSFAAGDKVRLLWGTGGTGTALVPTTIGILFAAAAGTVKRFVANGQPYTLTVTTQTACSLSGGAATTGLNGNDAPVQIKMRTAATWKNLYINVQTNTATQAFTGSSRIGGVAGAMAVSALAAATGYVEDTTHTDTLAIGDLVDHGTKLDAGSSGTLSLRAIGSELSTINSVSQVVSSDNGGAAQAANVTAFYSWGGHIFASTGTETTIQTKVQAACTTSNLQIASNTNTVTAASTFTFRKNGGAATQTVSVLASSAGLVEDITHTDALVASDEVAYQLVSGATGTSITPSVFGMLFTADTSIGIPSGTLSPRFVLFDTGQYGLGV